MIFFFLNEDHSIKELSWIGKQKFQQNKHEKQKLLMLLLSLHSLVQCAVCRRCHPVVANECSPAVVVGGGVDGAARRVLDGYLIR